MPTFFDKGRLQSPEFKKFIYTLKRRGRDKDVFTSDMTTAGYVHAASCCIKEITSEVIHYGPATPPRVDGRSGPVMAVVRVELTLQIKEVDETGAERLHQRIVTALADGSNTEFNDQNTLVRSVESRALKRAIARALDISKADFGSDATDEEEFGSPRTRDKEENSAPKPVDSVPRDIADEADTHAEEGKW